MLCFQIVIGYLARRTDVRLQRYGVGGVGMELQGNLADAERMVLEEAAHTMVGWISRLPASSEWRHAFLLARRHLVDAEGLSDGGLLRMLPPENPDA